MPLRLRLALLFALATAALIAVVGAAFLYQLRDSLEASLDTGLRARADVLVGRLNMQPASMSADQSDQITQVLAPDGRVLSSSQAAGGTALLGPARRQAAGTSAISFTTTVGEDRSRLLAVPARLSGQPVVAVVGTGTDISDTAEQHILSALLFGGPPAVLLSGIAAWLLAGAALRPVERMRRQVAEISETDRDARIALPRTRDEVAALGSTMNQLLGRLQRALVRERGFVADAGHELRTPLAILRTELELAARPGRSRQALVEAVAAAADETDRLSRLAEDLLLLARADDGSDFLRPTRVALDELLDVAVKAASDRAADRAVTLAVRAEPGLAVDADPDRIRQAVDNLLDNALRYAPAGTTVTVSAQRARRGKDSIVAIEVADEGPGFPGEFLPLAFERFRRADDARARQSGGSGLGLSIVRSIALAHGGRAVARNNAAGGASVAIELPTVPPVPHHP